MGDPIDGYETLTLTSPGGVLTATFVPALGNVVASLRAAGDELLGQRRGLARYASHGSSMGIPFLHPWANRLSRDTFTIAGLPVELPRDDPRVRRDPGGLAIHGLLGPTPWWAARAPTTSTLHAELEFGRPEWLELFPFPHRLITAAVLTDTSLTITTTVRPTGIAPVPVAFGYHPYLQLPGTPRADWHVELPVMTPLTAGPDGIPNGRGPRRAASAGPLGSDVYDDGFVDLELGARFAVSDPGGEGRRIEVTFDAGYPAAQVFAPATDDVICFEPMTAPTDALVSGDGLRIVAPGSTFSAVFSIEVTGVARGRTT
jgi:galactose mutarotase-like enzyme